MKKVNKIKKIKKRIVQKKKVIPEDFNFYGKKEENDQSVEINIDNSNGKFQNELYNGKEKIKKCTLNSLDASFDYEI